MLNGAIGALSAEELQSEEAICARLDKRQGSVLRQGLHGVGLSLSSVCTFVKGAFGSSRAPSVCVHIAPSTIALTLIRRQAVSSAAHLQPYMATKQCLALHTCSRIWLPSSV